MKKILFISLFIVLNVLAFRSLTKNIQAQNSYSLDEIGLHQTPEDCWMAIEGQVYDLSNYLPDHDRFLNIREWCGRDATKDYNTKAGMGRDHSIRADEMLAAYLIGDLATDEVVNLVEVNEVDEKIDSPNPNFSPKYNVYLPVLITIIIYYLSKKFLGKARHDFLWNSILLIGLIPVVVFGFILALADQIEFLTKINFNQMLSQHAQLSIIVGTAMILHMIQRAKIYLSQGKSSFRKRK
jgi:cytochrome b involved in lipid metabolism